MKSTYDIKKIKAVVLYIIEQSGGVIDYITLFKRMYFSQQKYLATYGCPIFHETFKAVKLGPVPSFTYKGLDSALFEDESVSPDMKDFAAAFDVTRSEGVKIVRAAQQPRMSAIAPAEKEVIDQVIAETANMTPQELSEKSHDDAWNNAIARAEIDPTDNRMSLVQIAKAGGATDEVIDYLRESQAFAYSFC